MILPLLIPRYQQAIESSSSSDDELTLLSGVFGPTLTEIEASSSRRRKNKRMGKAKADHVQALIQTEGKHGEDLVFDVVREGLVWSNDEETSLARAFSHLASVCFFLGVYMHLSSLSSLSSFYAFLSYPCVYICMYRCTTYLIISILMMKNGGEMWELCSME